MAQASERWDVNPVHELVLTKRWQLGYLLFALLGVLLVLWLTRMGPGMSGDSTSYLMGAENLFSGRGFSRYSGGYEIRPITGFPPFYSVALGLVSLSSASLTLAGRVLNAAAIGLTVLISGFMVQRYSRNPWAGLVTMMLMLLADSMLLWHSWIMSEGLYIFLMLVGLLGLLIYLGSEGRRLFLLLAAVSFAAASLTRYIGFSMFVVGLLAIALVKGSGWKRRVMDTLVFIGAGLAPVAFWLQRNVSGAGTMTNRELALHAIDPQLIRLYLAELSSWLIPHEVPLPTMVRATLALAIAAALLGTFFWLQHRMGHLRFDRPRIRLADRHMAALPWLTLLAIAGHLGVLAVNSLFLDASTTPPAVPRYLTPVFVLAVIFGVAWFSRMQEVLAWRPLAWLGGGYLIFLFAFYLINTLPLLQDPLPHMGYTAYRQRWKGVVDTLQQLDPAQPILANNPELVYVLAGRPAYVRPIRFDHYQETFRGDFQAQLDNAAEVLDAGGVFVVFHPIEPEDEATVKFTGAVPLVEYPQATFFGLPEERPLIDE